MKKQEKLHIEKMIREEIENQTPDNFSQIFGACKGVNNTSKGKILTMKTTNRMSIITKVAGIAAAFLILLTACIGVFAYANSTQAIISFDVNPGIEITLGRNDKVRKISATNDDGQTIALELDVKGKTLDETIDMVMDKFIEGGYISEEANSVLVSVNSKKIKDTEQMSTRITDSVNAKLTEAGVAGSIITQIVSENDEIGALADEYKMSFGKARLIYELVQKDGRHTFEELSMLTVHELHVLLRETELIPEDVKTQGDISEKDFISKEEALNIALTSVELTADDVSDIEIEFDYVNGQDRKKGIIVYDIEFETAEAEYDFDVNVKTGEILKSKIGDIDEEDKDEKNKDEEKHKASMDDEKKEPYKAEKRPENLIGKSEAFKQATEKAGFDADDMEDVDCEVKFKDGRWQYEIEFEDGQGKQKMQIDGLTGDVISDGKSTDKK